MFVRRVARSTVRVGITSPRFYLNKKVQLKRETTSFEKHTRNTTTGDVALEIRRATSDGGAIVELLLVCAVQTISLVIAHPMGENATIFVTLKVAFLAVNFLCRQLKN